MQLNKKQDKSNVALNKAILLTPGLLLLIGIMAIPLVSAVVLSFYGGRGSNLYFCGFENYLSFFSDVHLQDAFVNTLIFVVLIVPTLIIVSFIVAVRITKLPNVKIQNMLCTLLYLPCITSPVAYTLFFKQLAYPEGIMCDLFSFFGLYSPNGILSSIWSARIYIALICIWASFGFYTLLFTVAIQKVDQNIICAARIDGLSEFRIMRKILIPMIKPIFSLVLVLSTCNVFQIYIEVALLTKGGPASSTSTLTYYLYQCSFTFVSNYGYSAAIGVLILTICIIISVILLSMERKKHDCSK